MKGKTDIKQSKSSVTVNGWSPHKVFIPVVRDGNSMLTRCALF